MVLFEKARVNKKNCMGLSLAFTSPSAPIHQATQLGWNEMPAHMIEQDPWSKNGVRSFTSFFVFDHMQKRKKIPRVRKKRKKRTHRTCVKNYNIIPAVKQIKCRKSSR